MSLPAGYELFEKHMQITDYFKGLKVKVDPKKLAFVSQDQIRREADLLARWNEDVEHIKVEFDDNRVLQHNLKSHYDILYIDLMIECLRENGWGV